MSHLLAKLFRALALLSVCGAAGALMNFLVFVAPFLVLGGPLSAHWLRVYGDYNGTYFGLVTAVFGILVFPLVRRLRIS